MALRLGTGGLKYPIPVAPDAQQSIAAASAGGSASASAYGANRSFAANKMRVQADLANSAAERDFRARSQMEEQGFRARENFYDREHQAGAQLQGQEFRANQEELDRNFAAYQRMAGENFQANQSNLDRDFERERDRAQFDREDAAIAEQDAQQQANIDAGIAELSPQGQKQMDAIASARAKMAGEQQWTPEQREEADQKWKDQERRIRRTAGKPRGPDATERANSSQTFFDPQTGKYEKEMGPGRIPGSVGQNGEFKPTVEAPDTSKEDQRRQSWIDKRADDLMKQENDDGKPVYSPEDAARMAMQDWDKRQKGFQPGAGPGGTWQGPPAAPGQTAPPPAPAPGQPGSQPAPAPGQPATHPTTAQDAPVSREVWIANRKRAYVERGMSEEEATRKATEDRAAWRGRGADPLPGQTPAPGQQAPSVPLPGKPVGPTPTPQTLPLNPATASSAGPVPLGGSGAQEATPDAFTKQWSALPPGGTMIGPDGKFYTKKK
jgi:hypothetical protein